MDFLKRHYEKILLGIVLLGLVGGLVVLPIYIMRDRELLTEYSTSIVNRTPQPLAPLNMTEESNVMKILQAPYKLDFETTNRLFNPVEWQREPNGKVIKIELGNEVGPSAVDVTRITPLYFTLTLDSVQSNEFGARYVIGVERQAAPVAWQRVKRQHYASVGERNDTFTITAVKGPAGDPTQLVLHLADSGETATIFKGKPYRRVDAYMADLKYAPEEKSWDDRRVGDDLKFGADDYIIVAINQSEVVLSAQSNQKKWTLPYKSQ